MLHIQKYDVQIKYVPGEDIPVSDALSRISSCHDEAIQGLDVSVQEVYLQLNSSPMRVPQIREETEKDTTFSAQREIITHGWPEKRSNCPASLHAYWNYCDALTVADVLILKGKCINLMSWNSYTMPIKVLRNVSSGLRDQYVPPMSASPEVECQGTLAFSYAVEAMA